MEKQEQKYINEALAEFKEKQVNDFKRFVTERIRRIAESQQQIKAIQNTLESYKKEIREAELSLETVEL